MRWRLWTASIPLLLPACGAEPDLVVYCSLDQVHSEPILREFAAQTGLRVQGQWDVEANKTVGMVQRLLAERDRPRADVYWNNEIAHTLRLKEEGMLAPYASPSAADIPSAFKDPDHTWHGFAARARVILHHKDYQGPLPQTLEDFLVPSIAQQGGMARPLTGTTLTHCATMATRRGEEGLLTWLTAAQKSGLRFGAGNASVMRRVCERDYSWCLTDTDDAAAAIRNGYPVSVSHLGQSNGKGSLLIPNTAALIQGAPHPEQGKKFLDFLLSKSVEERLAHADSEQIPLRADVKTPATMLLPGKDFKVQSVQWAPVQQAMEPLRPILEEFFTTAE
ncbi:MAG: extracellular solute-binding protein [Planctomycetes bacterium]|nr:extracellular solute-binding protein [Planctomycetota bacterium]